jgi:hypothetical protein
VKSNFGVGTGETIHFSENIACLPIFIWFSTSLPSNFSQQIYTFLQIPLDQAK